MGPYPNISTQISAAKLGGGVSPQALYFNRTYGRKQGVGVLWFDEGRGYTFAPDCK